MLLLESLEVGRGFLWFVWSIIGIARAERDGWGGGKGARIAYGIVPCFFWVSLHGSILHVPTGERILIGKSGGLRRVDRRQDNSKSNLKSPPYRRAPKASPCDRVRKKQ